MNPYRFQEIGPAMSAPDHLHRSSKISLPQCPATRQPWPTATLASLTLVLMLAIPAGHARAESEYVISDRAALAFEKDAEATATEADTARSKAPQRAPEPGAPLADEQPDHERAPARLSFEGFLGEVTQAAMLRPLRAKVVSDRPVAVVDDELVSEWSVGDDETLDYRPVEPETVFSGDCGPACCPRWIVQADALFLWQNNIASRTLFIDNNTATPVLDANDIRPSVGIGPRLAVLRNFNESSAFEANYFIVQSLTGTASLPLTSPPAYEQADLNGFIYNDIDSVTVDTESQIQSLELNYRERKGFATFLAGFRYVEWMSAMQINDTFTTTPVVAPSFSGTDSFLTETGNELYGGQLGCDLMLWNRGQTIRVNGLGKAGIFYNQAFQRTTIVTDAPPGSPGFTPINATESQSMQQTSFFGEVGANATVELTNWLSWRVGYTLFWLSGVATPANQLSVVTLDPGTGATVANGINTSGSVLLHGVTTGVEARW
jgi:hypothetical protein